MNDRVAIQTVSPSRNLIVVQRNPTSGSGRGRREIWRLYQSLRAKGFEVRIFHCRERFSRFVHRTEGGSGIRCLVAAGGDGTISSLVQRHPKHPIAVLPLGTENLVAKHLGIRRNGQILASIIQDGRHLAFDTGLAGTHRFLLMASAGLDAEVVRLLAASRRGNISHFTYLKPVIQAFRKYPFPDLKVLDESGAVLASGSHVIVANMAEYGMKIPFCPTADPHDGLLDVRVFTKTGAIRTVLHVFRTMLGRRDLPTDVRRFCVPRLSVISGDADLPLQADGDPCGCGATSFRIADEKMRLMVPCRFRFAPENAPKNASE